MAEQTTTPDWFYEQVQQTLREWHTGSGHQVPLLDTILVQERLAGCPDPSTAQAWKTVREVVDNEMELLRQQGQDEDMSLLRRRFLDRWTAQRVAFEINTTDHVVFQRQRKSLRRLADALWAREALLRERRSRRSAARLPSLEAVRLFGVQDKFEQLVSLLKEPEEPRVLAVDGIGGIGKTTLAIAAARHLLGSPRYDEVAWISARQEDFTPWMGLQATQKPALTFDNLMEELIEQLSPEAPQYGTPAQQWATLHPLLQERACLVIIDNLETAEDHQALAPQVRQLANGRSKFLLTSRFSLYQHFGIYSISLDELDEPDALALFRHEARIRGLHELVNAPASALHDVYEVVGGNPLALKLVVGQAYLLPLAQVVENLRQAQGRRAEELYHFVYWYAWNQLDSDAQDVLVHMATVSQQGATLEHLQEINELSGARLSDALDRLVTLSLVNVGGDVDARRYSIHRLTETFLLQEVLKWKGVGAAP